MSVLAVLKHATADAHERVEALLPLTSPALTRERYAAVLRAFHALYAPLERAVARGLAAPGPDGWRLADFAPERRARLARLEGDLRALGAAPHPAAARAAAALVPALADVPAALGAMYVTEGATLGGRVIARHLRDALGVDESNGGAFFAGYGAETGAMWTRYREQAEDYARRFGGEGTMRGAAVATFDAFERWLGAALAEPTASGPALGAPHVGRRHVAVAGG